MLDPTRKRGYCIRVLIVFFTCCVSRLVLEIDSSIGIQSSSSAGVGGATSSSSVVLLASLPGRLKAQLTQLPVNRIDVKWSVEKIDDKEEFILLHKSHCLGVCLEETSQVSYIVYDVYVYVAVLYFSIKVGQHKK